MQHYCFDKDGTLIDVHAYWTHNSLLRARALAERLGLPDRHCAVICRGMGVDPSSERILPSGPIGYRPRDAVINGAVSALAAIGSKAEPELIGDVFRELDRRQQQTDDYRIEPIRGVANVLAKLHTEGAVLSLYSSDRRENSERILERLGWHHFFKTIVGGGCVTRPKPDPQGLTLACDNVQVKSADTAYVSDTVSDMRMAKAIGARAIGVAVGLDSASALEAVADAAYADFESWGGESPQ